MFPQKIDNVEVLYLFDTIEDCMNIFKNVDWRSAK